MKSRFCEHVMLHQYQTKEQASKQILYRNDTLIQNNSWLQNKGESVEGFLCYCLFTFSRLNC